MSRDGSLVFGDLIGKLDYLRADCSKCGHSGHYAVLLLIQRHGADAKLTDWLSKITADYNLSISSLIRSCYWIIWKSAAI